MTALNKLNKARLINAHRDVLVVLTHVDKVMPLHVVDLGGADEVSFNRVGAEAKSPKCSACGADKPMKKIFNVLPGVSGDSCRTGQLILAGMILAASEILLMDGAITHKVLWRCGLDPRAKAGEASCIDLMRFELVEETTTDNG